MDPFVAYNTYNALKLHFASESYDYLKYNGQTKNGGTVAAHRKFLANKQKIFFAQLSKHDDPQGLVVANLLENPKAYITDIIGPDGQDVYLRWLGRQNRISHLFKTELESARLCEGGMRMMKLDQNGLPVLIHEYIAGTVSPETVAIIDHFANRLDVWAKTVDHPLMKQVQLKLRKYKPFVKFNKTKVKQILQEQIELNKKS